MTKKSIQSVMN